jgi:hypothetical protein
VGKVPFSSTLQNLRRTGSGNNLDAASFFSGLLDDVRIYNVALSAEEIEELVR